MPPLAVGPVEVVPVVALLVLLVTAIRHPSGRVEAVVAVLAGAATLATGLLSGGDAEAVVRHLGPVIGFLMTILVVGEVCSRAGVFSYAGHLVARASRGRSVALMSGVFVLAAVVTAVLSLDATVVLLMPWSSVPQWP
ncbi:MAG: SLC13 family permease [Nocardioides sp.]